MEPHAVSASEPDTGVGEAACVLWFGQRLTRSSASKTDPASEPLLPIRGEYPAPIDRSNQPDTAGTAALLDE
jgi:hypothetical protein